MADDKKSDDKGIPPVTDTKTGKPKEPPKEETPAPPPAPPK